MRIRQPSVEVFQGMIFIMDYKKWLGRILSIIFALLVWQLIAMNVHQSILLVTPVAVIKRLFTIWQVKGFVNIIWFSFSRIVIGFLLGFIIGNIMAFLSKAFSFVETLLWPWMVTIKSVPVASFVVICLVWLTSRNLSVLISFLVVLPVIYQNVLTGLKNQDEQLVEMAEVMHMRSFDKLRYITMSSIAPYLVSASKLTCNMAWKAGIAAEIIAMPGGSIGKIMHNAKMYLATDDLFAWTIIVVILSVIFERCFSFVLKKILGRSLVK